LHAVREGFQLTKGIAAVEIGSIAIVTRLTRMDFSITAGHWNTCRRTTVILEFIPVVAVLVALGSTESPKANFVPRTGALSSTTGTPGTTAQVLTMNCITTASVFAIQATVFENLIAIVTLLNINPGDTIPTASILAGVSAVITVVFVAIIALFMTLLTRRNIRANQAVTTMGDHAGGWAGIIVKLVAIITTLEAFLPLSHIISNN